MRGGGLYQAAVSELRRVKECDFWLGLKNTIRLENHLFFCCWTYSTPSLPTLIPPLCAHAHSLPLPPFLPPSLSPSLPLSPRFTRQFSPRFFTLAHLLPHSLHSLPLSSPSLSLAVSQPLPLPLSLPPHLSD